ncbi:MAG: VOC family protein [Caulobacteraceae bacterium]|nr:VOC family protein [Caulobacter sp.]
MTGFAALVPELGVDDIAASLAFWCGPLGFTVAYDRPAARFAYLEREGAQVMLCERNGRWDTGGTVRPYGRGLNLQITVAALQPILNGLAQAGWPLFAAPAEAWYRAGPVERGQREMLVQDPDGYLLRFAEFLGLRAV